MRLFLRITFIFTFLFICISSAGYVLVEISVNSNGTNKDPEIILVHPGDGDNTISWELFRKNIISNRAYFFIAKYAARKPFVPKVGEYEIPAYATLFHVMEILNSVFHCSEKSLFQRDNIKKNHRCFK